MYKRQQCVRCKKYFRPKEYIRDESGTGYSTRLAQCKHCGHKMVIDFEIDYCWKMLGDTGMDPRYY